MRLWELESALGQLASFEKAKVEYEQYPTSAHLAARIVHLAAQSFDDIEEKTVLDLGTGPGMLACAAALSGAAHVVAVDIDSEAIDVARRNRSEMNAEDTIDFICADIEQLPLLPTKCIHTCIQNPPFGTRVKGIDVVFVKAAISRVTSAVYSLHKTSTRDYLLSNAKQWGALGGASVLAELVFDIPKMYDFHSKQSADIRVDLIRFDVSGTARLPSQLPLSTPPAHARQRDGRTSNRKGRGKGVNESSASKSNNSRRKR